MHPAFVCGGERGIRTLGTVLAFTRFPIVRLRPAQPSLHLLDFYIISQKSKKSIPFLKKYSLFLKNNEYRQKNIKKISKKVLTIRFRYAIMSTFRKNARWCGSMAEQLICNQQVVGSTPITSSKKQSQVTRLLYGGFPERPKGADCKSVVTDFGGPNPPSPTRKKHFFTKCCFHGHLILHV